MPLPHTVFCSYHNKLAPLIAACREGSDEAQVAEGAHAFLSAAGPNLNKRQAGVELQADSAPSDGAEMHASPGIPLEQLVMVPKNEAALADAGHVLLLSEAFAQDWFA